MKATILFISIFILSTSCRQFVTHEKNMKNAKKMGGVWEVFEMSNGNLNGTLIMTYNIENELEHNQAKYYRSSGVISYFLWWMNKDDFLFLYNTESKLTFTYKIIELKKNYCVLERDDGSRLELKRKVKL